MKILLQRVNKASVKIEDKTVGSIGKGYVLMVGIGQKDDDNVISKAIEKIINLRLFENAKNKFDKDLREVNGEVLVISQFTLFGKVEKGRRPYFGDALEPRKAIKLYEKFVDTFKKRLGEDKVESGEFAAYMTVNIENDGPVTMPLEFG